MRCDWCGSTKDVFRTNYGSTISVRFICKACSERLRKDGITVKKLSEKE